MRMAKKQTKSPDRSDGSWLPLFCDFTHTTLIVGLTLACFMLTLISPKPTPQETILVDQHQALICALRSQFQYVTPTVIWKQYS